MSRLADLCDATQSSVSAPHCTRTEGSIQVIAVDPQFRQGQLGLDWNKKKFSSLIAV